MHRSVLLSLCVVTMVASSTADARFGKKSSKTDSNSSSNNDSSNNTHSATPVGGSNGSSNGGSNTGYTRYSPGPRVRYYRPHSRWGFWAGAFVPGTWGSAHTVSSAEPMADAAPSALRVSAGAEAMGFFTAPSQGFTLGVNVGVEGERWGFFVNAQNISVRADDGTNGLDHLQQLNAHLSFALLAGDYGRLRIEAGADTVFAPDLIALGPTVGLSGVVWVGGPFAIEASIMGTPWPYQQLDGKLGLGIGVGPLGVRAGFRVQVLDDRGLVDGVAHRDIFMGPYVGLSVIF